MGDLWYFSILSLYRHALSWQIHIFLKLKGLDLSDQNDGTWVFPIDGGRVEYDSSSIKFLPPSSDKLHDENIALVSCQPPNRKSKF